MAAPILISNNDMFQHSWKTYKSDTLETNNTAFLQTEPIKAPAHSWDAICVKLDELEGKHKKPFYLNNTILKLVLVTGAAALAALIIYTLL